MKTRMSGTKILALLGLAVSLLFTQVSQAEGLSCARYMETLSVLPTRGSHLGPIEFIRNLKQKIVRSRLNRRFDQDLYQKSMQTIRAEKLEIDGTYLPKSLEEYIAYLDVRLADTSVSITSMQPILRHKIYKTVKQMLKSKSHTLHLQYAEGLADLIFRGNYTKPTSFAFLLTNTPQEVGAEMFVQHLHLLGMVQAVRASLEYTEGPVRPGLMSRMKPEFVRKHAEWVSAGFWTGVSVASAIHVHSAEGLALPSLNIYKLHQNRERIESRFLEVGVDKTVEELIGPMKYSHRENYELAVFQKVMNWYFLTTMISIFI